VEKGRRKKGVAGEKGEGENRLPFFGRARDPSRHYSRERAGNAEAPRRRDP